MGTTVISIPDIPSNTEDTFSEMPDSLLATFKQYGTLREVVGSLGNLFAFGGSDAFFLHRNGYIFRKSTTGMEDSPVFAIEMEYVTEQTFMPGSETRSAANTLAQGQGSTSGSKYTSSVWGLPPSLQSQERMNLLTKTKAAEAEKLAYQQAIQNVTTKSEHELAKNKATLALTAAESRLGEFQKILIEMETYGAKPKIKTILSAAAAKERARERFNDTETFVSNFIKNLEMHKTNKSSLFSLHFIS